MSRQATQMDRAIDRNNVGPDLPRARVLEHRPLRIEVQVEFGERNEIVQYCTPDIFHRPKPCRIAAGRH
jgi:hypothetical protein